MAGEGVSSSWFFLDAFSVLLLDFNIGDECLLLSALLLLFPIDEVSNLSSSYFMNNLNLESSKLF
jgi:hypothetical protein